jgi:hypothetical protein
MKTIHKLTFLFFSFLTLSFFGCQSEDPEPENEGEVITDVILTFRELDLSNNPIGNPFSFKASDPQGIEVGSTPSIETINVTKGKKYLMTIQVLNSIAGEDITQEIRAEASSHQFFFLGSAFSSNILTIVYADPNGVALGLQNFLTVSSSPGTNNTQMRVVLRHDLDKNFPGASNPNFANFVQAGGETDLDITFPVVIN